jgi:DNA-binding LacI/PurR family transcriptional regulator
MVDVAREAGVAHVTVSRVLNDHPSVRPETRERVLAAISHLGYQRNDLARALKSGRSMTIGVVIAGSELFELPRVLSGIEAAAQTAGYWVNLASWQGGTAEQLAATVDRVSGQATEGVVIIADRPVVEKALTHVTTRVPVSVVMSGEIQNPAIGSVELDQQLGARLATQHLLDLGHREIVHLTGRLNTFDARARVDGWRATMERAGVARPEALEGDFTGASGYRLGAEIAARQTLPTAIFASNDQMAMGVLSAFAEHGVRVPYDTSLVGFDDQRGAEYLVPALTTVRQDFYSLGHTAIEVLLDLMGGVVPRHHLIEPTLVLRKSSAPPRSV